MSPQPRRFPSAMAFFVVLTLGLSMGGAAQAAPLASSSAAVGQSVAAAAQAGKQKPSRVKLQRIRVKKKAPWRGKVQVKPRFKKIGKPKIVSARLKVRRAGKVIRNNKKRVRLPAGKYRVIQTVKYRPREMKLLPKTYVPAGKDVAQWDRDGDWWVECEVDKLIQPLAQAQATCLVEREDWDDDLTRTWTVHQSVTYNGTGWYSPQGERYTNDDDPIGAELLPDTFVTPVDLVANVNTATYGPVKTLRKRQQLRIRPKFRGCATPKEFHRVQVSPIFFGHNLQQVFHILQSPGQRVHIEPDDYWFVEVRAYPMCGGQNVALVVFADGVAMLKELRRL